MLKIISIIIIVLIVIFLVYFIIPTYLYKLIYKIKRKKKGNTIFLTFDDGPSKYTEKLLDILKKYNVKATFFCVGEFAREYPKTIERMEKENHVIALHSLNHTNAILMSIENTANDFIESLKIMNRLNRKIIYYRPPWGHLTITSLLNIKKNNLKLVSWNVMAEDWKATTTSKEIENKLLKRVHGKDIICLHDGRGENEAPLRTIKALDKVIPKLLEKGYIFETIDKYYEN